MTICKAMDCDREIDADKLMCKLHWGKVPPKLKHALKICPKPENPADRKDWNSVAFSAIEAVAAIENRLPPPVRRIGTKFVCDVPEGYNNFIVAAGRRVIAIGPTVPPAMYENGKWILLKLEDAPAEVEQEGLVFASES